MGKNITAKRGSFHHQMLQDHPRVFREKNNRIERTSSSSQNDIELFSVDFMRLAGNGVVKDTAAGEQGF
jgi:hypothetical protein